MATAKIDRLTTLSARDEYGVVTEATRKAIVVDLVDTDIGVLDTALGVLDTDGYTVGSGDEHYPNLVLVERVPSLVSGDPETVEVELRYVHLAANEYQTLGEGEKPIIIVETSIEQILTPRKYPFSSGGALQEEMLEVSHTYPPDHEVHPGKTIKQTGEITVTVGRRRAILRGLWKNSREVIELWLNKLNKDIWLGGAPLTWLCTRADVALFDASTSPRTHRCHFEFEYREETWEPIVQFVDPETGRPPADLVKDEGWKVVTTVYWMPWDYLLMGNVHHYYVG